MKVSLNWLTDYVDVGAVLAAELGEVFTNIGLCCDAIDQTDSDVVFDLEVTSNRPDCLGHIGVARELAAVPGVGQSVGLTYGFQTEVSDQVGFRAAPLNVIGVDGYLNDVVYTDLVEIVAGEKTFK